jgi:uncharacterized protein HemY
MKTFLRCVVPPSSAPRRASITRSLSILGIKMRPLQAYCHHGLGILYAQLDQWEQARVELATAIDFYRGMQMTLWLSQAEEALAQV